MSVLQGASTADRGRDTYVVQAASAATPGPQSTTAHMIFPQDHRYEWWSESVGAPSPAGSATAEGDVFTVAGAGVDIWGTADQFHFATRTLEGDGTVVARVASQDNTNQWAKAGVMVREDLTAASRHVSMFVTPTSGAALQSRSVAGDVSSNTAGPLVAAPYWVRLVRQGTTITGSVSPDGQSWTSVGSHTMSLSSTVHVGLAVTSHNDGVTSTAVFDNVAVTTTAASEPEPEPEPEPAPVVAGRGLHYTPDEVAVWRQRAQSGPYRAAGDVSANSPGDWSRISANAAAFLSNPAQARWAGPVNNNPGGCVQQDFSGASNPPTTATHRLRDSAFTYLITQDTRHRDAVKAELLAQAAQAGTNFADRSRWCLRTLWDINPSFDIAVWMTQLLFAYDYLGPDSFTTSERHTLNTWFYNAADYWQEDMNSSLNNLFVNRWTGDYRLTTVAQSCGSSSIGYYGGKTICNLAKYYNNRRAHLLAYAAFAGLKLDMENYVPPAGAAPGRSLTHLQQGGKLLVKEWLMFSVYPEGFIGEFERSSSSLPILGWAYAAGTVGPMIYIADHFARAGDTELYDFTTSFGYHGSEGGNKSLAFVIESMARYVDGTYTRYATTSSSGLTDDNRIRSFHTPTNYHSNVDVGFTPANVYYRDTYAKTAYLRTAPGMPAYPATPADAGLHGWMGNGRYYPGVLFQYGQMENHPRPYPNHARGLAETTG